MPKYKYRGISEEGRPARGMILALNKTHAIESIKNEDIQPVAIKRIRENKKKYKKFDYNRMKKRTEVTDRAFIRKQKKRKQLDFKNMSLKELSTMEFHPFSKVSTKDVIAFVNNFYILKKARFNNIQALQSVYEGTENPMFKDVIEDVLIGVQAGQKLYVTMMEYPKVFPPMFVNFVRVGEEAGTLDTALLHARDYVESSLELKKRIKSTVIPRFLQFFGIFFAMIACVLIGVPILQMVYDMFESSKQIPAATMWMLGIANWLVEFWYIPIGILGALLGIFFIYISTSRGRYNWDKFLLTCPVIGDVVKNITINKFFQAMLLNLKNGMRIQESLEVSKSVTNNYYFLSAIEAGKANALLGESWITPFEDKKLFKPMVSEMVNVGMKTDLPEMMEKVNEYIGIEINESMERFKKWLPEITYLFVGIVLVAFVITVVLPIVDVYMGGFIEVPV